jgi:hypothetical protein
MPTRRKKGSRREEHAQPSNSLDPPKESMGKKLRSLRHSLGRRDQQDQLQRERESWNSGPIVSTPWVHGSSGETEGSGGDSPERLDSKERAPNAVWEEA